MIRLGSPVIREALLHFGYGHQTFKAIEELSELQRALAKEAMHEPRAVDNIVEEIADCLIMLEQLAVIHGQDRVSTWHRYKLERLERMIIEGKE